MSVDSSQYILINELDETDALGDLLRRRWDQLRIDKESAFYAPFRSKILQSLSSNDFEIRIVAFYMLQFTVFPSSKEHLAVTVRLTGTVDVRIIWSNICKQTRCVAQSKSRNATPDFWVRFLWLLRS
jgi:hypothetical protein